MAPSLDGLTRLSEGQRQAAIARLFNSSALGELRRRCYELLLEHWQTAAIPTNATFLFYELEQQGVIAKKRGVNPRTGKPYVRTHRQEISDATMDLREEGLIPWDWLTDETRSVADWSYEATVLDYVVKSAEHARIDAWDGMPPPRVSVSLLKPPGETPVDVGPMQLQLPLWPELGPDDLGDFDFNPDDPDYGPDPAA
jgi:hypothetical protein